MADLLQLEVASPERLLVREQVAEVQIPARGGYIGVLPGHAPLLGELGTGFLHYTAGGRQWYLAIHRGFVEVLDNHVRVLANMAERAEEIDVDRAREALRRAQEQLTVDPALALEQIASSEARLAAAAHKS
jgi:F-type H+-transporting ATPase subunit epsilon